MSAQPIGYQGNEYPVEGDLEKKLSKQEGGAGEISESVVEGETATTDPHMHRSLKGRQISMIAIAGTIGTGLFLGSGRALANGGPVGALIGYTVVGILVGCMMYSLGEMMVYDPSAGGFIEFSARYVDPAVGFAVGWQFWFQTAITAPVEVVAASIVIQYWDQNNDHLAIYVAVFLVGMIAINLAGVKYFGEFEFWFAFIKIAAVLGLILFCLVIDLGGGPDRDRRGFRYWRDEPFNGDYLGIQPASKARFLGFWAVLTQASFSYGGMESLASLCLEASNPQKTMKTAVRAIFYRIVGLYILAILMIGLCVQRSNPNLLQANKEGGGTAAQSPFVVVVKVAGVKVLDHIINAVVLTSAFSSGNEFLYASSRALFMLSQQGQAPRFFSKILPNGVPIYALGFTSLFSLLAFLNVSAGATTAFNWLANITTLGSQISWINIAIANIRFNRALKVQGLSRAVLPFRCPAFMPYAVVVGFIPIVFFAGWTTLVPFSASNFFSTYVNLAFFACLVVGWKFAKKTQWVKLSDMDIASHYEQGQTLAVSKFGK